MRSMLKTTLGLSSCIVIAVAQSSSGSAGAAPASSIRPASAAATSAAGTTTAAAGAPPAVTSGPASVGQAQSISFASTGPSAITLASITQGVATASIGVLHPKLSATPGATPPISGAPPLPSWSYTPGTFPPLDMVPDVSSPQVSAWMQEVANSGVAIPNIPPTVAGGCGSNAAAAADTSRCWWTCGECTRSTDVTTCPDKLTWGVSYDDGPSPWTPDLLNFMDDVNIKSTFFIVGSRAISRSDILQAEYMAGHQLAVHTWSHPYLTTLTNQQIIAELGWTREAIRQITGVSPNFMRPPYGDIDDRVRAICQAMQMTPIIWTSVNGNDFDTNDWHIPSGQSVQSVAQDFDNILKTAQTLSTGFIVLSHDLYQQTVELATGYILPSILAMKNPSFNLQPIITCMHKPLGDAYLETNNNQTNPFSNNAQALTGSAGVTGTTVGASGSGSAASSGSTGSTKSGSVAVVSSGAIKAMAAVAAAVVGGALLVI